MKNLFDTAKRANEHFGMEQKPKTFLDEEERSKFKNNCDSLRNSMVNYSFGRKMTHLTQNRKDKINDAVETKI